jgi:hypothetical protein
MRKDKGLSGDLDRLPMLTWIMFLKFLGDLEQMREVAGNGGKGKEGRRRISSTNCSSSIKIETGGEV